MNDYIHGFIIILIIGLVTLATRVVPALIFRGRKKVPGYINYLGRTVPYTAMGLLIVYCLRDVSVFSSTHAIPEIIALAVVSGTYIWKRNTIASVVIGTILYMILVQSIG